MDSIPAVGRQRKVITDEEIREIPNWEHSKILGEGDKAVIEYAEKVSKTPVRVSDELFGKLKRYFSDEQIVELTASIAYENYRARFNHALHIGSENLYE